MCDGQAVSFYYERATLHLNLFVPRKRKNGERADGIAIDYRDHRASGACGLRDFAGAEPDINGGDYAGANAYDSPSAGYESGCHNSV